MCVKCQQWSGRKTRHGKVVPCNILEHGPELLNDVDGDCTLARKRTEWKLEVSQVGR